MTARATSTEPCWILTHELDGEWIWHYSSKADALHELAKQWNEAIDEEGVDWQQERPDLVESQPDKHSDGPCVELICDGCGDALGREGEPAEPGKGVHIDPAEVEHLLEVEGWSVDPETGNDFCPTCPPPPESEEELRRKPGPDDVPLFPLGDDS